VCEVAKRYDSDSTSTGLTRAARRAGAMQASNATTPVETATVPSSTGSVGWTPKARQRASHGNGTCQAEQQADADPTRRLQ
jgi:hypothetical protein